MAQYDYEKPVVDEENDFLETKEVPRVMSWRKIRLWIRDRQSKYGLTYEARLLTVEGKIQRQVAKGFVKDTTYGKTQFSDMIKKGFKCNFCEHSFKLNTQLMEMEELKEVQEVNAFNFLCGFCWGRQKKAGRKMIKLSDIPTRYQEAIKAGPKPESAFPTE